MAGENSKNATNPNELFMDDRDFALLFDELCEESGISGIVTALTEFCSEVAFENNIIENAEDYHQNKDIIVNNQHVNDSINNQPRVFDIQNGYSDVDSVDILDPNLTFQQRHDIKMRRRMYLNNLIVNQSGTGNTSTSANAPRNISNVQPHEVINYGASTSSGRGSGRSGQPSDHPGYHRVNDGASTSAGQPGVRDQQPRAHPSGQQDNNTMPSVPSGSGLQQQQPPPKHYRVLAEIDTFYPRFQIRGLRLQIRFNNPRHNEEMLKWIDRCLAELVNNIKKGMFENDKIGLEFVNQSCPDKPFYVSPRLVCLLDKDIILERMNKVLQSNQNFFLNDVLSVAITQIKMPHGGRNIDNKPFEAYLKAHNGGLVNIKRKDNKCLAYSIITAKIFHESDTKQFAKFRRTIKKEDFEWLDYEYEEFWKPLGVDVTNGATIDDVKKVQDALSDRFRIHVFLDRSGRELAFTPLASSSQNLIDVHLLLEENHFVFIKPNALKSVFGYNFYCIHCRQGYYKKGAHYKCKFTCSSCFEPNQCVGPEEYCALCNRTFNGVACKQTHLKNKICKNMKRCKSCGVIEPKHSVHMCGLHYCIKCRQHRPSPHSCMIAKLEEKKSVKNEEILYVYYDFEARMDEPVEGAPGKFKHVPNLCIAFQRCKNCPDLVNPDDIETPCESCGTRKHIFEKDNTLHDFIDYLLNLDEKHKKVIAIAHNTRAYDGHFVLQGLLEKRNDEPTVIVNGSQILAIFLTRYRFIDSLNFLNCGLSKLPAIFGLTGLKKGYYPYLHNTKANENAQPGKIPEKEKYMPDGMMPEDRADFDDWYESQKDVIFDNFKELKSYCQNDVFLLMQACEKFRRLFFAETQFEIFRDSITMASACMSVYRTHFMQPDTIPIIPKNGYRLKNNQSKAALKWLYWLKEKKGVKNLLFAGNGTEHKICGKFYADGFDPYGGKNGRGKVYEFLGDFYHQCPKHFGHTRPSPEEINRKDFSVHNHLSMRYEETMARLRIIEAKHDVEIIWECDFRKLEKTPEFKAFEEEYSHYWTIEKLNPRDALHGGRVNNLKIYKKVDENKEEKILYNDITSLYPYICREGIYPVGHPKIYDGSEIHNFDINTMHGLVKLKIQPPKNLYIPVLPQKRHDKLLFHLCQKCADDEHKDFCEHSDDQRSITGTYVIEEVRLALKKGYEIEKIYEAWVYKTVQRGVGNQEGLFTGYVNTFLRLKQEASGYPVDATTDALKKQYRDIYKAKENIDLRENKIESNPGLRAIAKNCLNGLWGKFGERENKRRTVIVGDRAEMMDYISDRKYSVQKVFPINNQKTLIHYKYVDEEAPGLNHANVVIAAFTTAQARIELYKYLEELGERVLYMDTDGLLFESSPGQKNLETNVFLGGMTDELISYGKGSYATEFVSGGPKNYGLKIFSTKYNDYRYICKVKGITLNSENVEHLNFESMKDMITDSSKPQSIRLVNKNKISRTLGQGIWSSEQAKTYKPVLTKRWRKSKNSYDTYPYGMKVQKTDDMQIATDNMQIDEPCE